MARHLITVNEVVRARATQFTDYDSPLSLAEIKEAVVAEYAEDGEEITLDDVDHWMILEWLDENAVMGGYGSEIDEILDTTERTVTESVIQED